MLMLILQFPDDIKDRIKLAFAAELPPTASAIGEEGQPADSDDE